MSNQHKFLLDESHLPKAWYNINADMPVPPQPVLHPGTMEPVTPDFLSALFPMSIILQEVSQERWIEIPEPVRDIYKLWRPTPMCRAQRLEKMLDTPAHIYYKYEGVSPVGSHKPNTAVAQAFFNKQAGTKALTTETGAGQWGSALAMACSFFGLPLEVYMVKVSYHQKPYRRIIMQNFGAEVYASPSERTQFGRSVVAKDPDSNGSLGIAISEAVEVAATSDGVKKYSLGSVLGHVLMHQSVIGIESLQQMEMAGEYPGDRLRRRRFQFRRLHLSVSAPEFHGEEEYAADCGRARKLPVLDQGPLQVRLRRHGSDGSDRQDAHPRPYVYAAGNPRWRAALSRHGAQSECAARSRRHRGARAPTTRDI
jgi:tryptophan synthase beta chain